MGLTLFVTNMASLGLKKVGADHVLSPESSNKNEVIRAVLNPLLFFLRKDLAGTKSTKSTKSTKRHKDIQAKAQNAKKRINGFSPLDIF